MLRLPKFFGKVNIEVVPDQKRPPVSRTFGGVSGLPFLSGAAPRLYPYMGTDRSNFYLYHKTRQVVA